MSEPPAAGVPRRVLYVDYSIGFGGAAKSLSLTLDEAPHIDATLFSSQDDAILRTWFASRTVHRFRRLVNYRTKARWHAALSQPVVNRLASRVLALADLAATHWNARRMVRVIRRNRIEVLHLNNGFTPPEALLAARRSRIPCIVHLRDFQHEPAEITHEVAASVHRVIAVSDAVGRSLGGTPVAPHSITTVHDPVDFHAIDAGAPARARIRAECGIADTAIAVAIFGRIIPWKGQLVFVQAVTHAMRTDPSIRAVIVGNESDGGRAYLDEVRRAIHDSGMEDRFFLSGYRENVEEFYAAMDIVVHASITPEPFGMVVPEAMAAGAAVIAADAGGPREIIRHGVDGLLSAPGDIDALAASIGTLAGDAELRSRLAQAGRITARERFGIAESAARVTAIYDELLGSHASAVTT